MILPDTRVSALSLYGDNEWDFSIELASQRLAKAHRALSFAMTLADGTSLLDGINAALLADAKRLCFFLLHEDHGIARQPRTIVELKCPFKYLFGELVRRGHRSLSAFCFDVAEDIVQGTLISRRDPRPYLTLYIQLWRHHDVLAHPPLQPPAPGLIERWRRGALGKRIPTAPLEPEEALMLSGFALSIVRHAVKALETCRRPTRDRFRRALARCLPNLELSDVLTAIHVVTVLETCLRALEYATLPSDCIAEKDAKELEPLFALRGLRWKGRKGYAGIQTTWRTSPHVAEAISLLKQLAKLHDQDALVFVKGVGERWRPGNTSDIGRWLRKFAEKWNLKASSGGRLHLNSRILRATASMLIVRYGESNGSAAAEQLKHAPGSRVTEGHYCQIAPRDLQRLVSQAPMPFHSKYGPLDISDDA
jgi:integrase